MRCGAAGSGASGSSTRTTKLFVFAGAPDHCSGGDVSEPSHVYFLGMPAIAVNAGDWTLRVMAPSFSGFGFASPVDAFAVSANSRATPHRAARPLHEISMVRAYSFWLEQPCCVLPQRRT